MVIRTLQAVLFSALALVATLTPTTLAAQTVLVRVVANDTSQPVFGALAHLIDDAGQPIRSVLTDERGRALFSSVPPARYRVRAEMIGMATGESTAFEIAQGGTDAGEIRLAPRPIDLAGIDVTAERRRCTARPAGEGLMVATLWEEARKALSAAALTDRQGQLRYETMVYERDVDANGGVVLRDEESRRDGFMRAPFESLPPEDFAEGGFVRRDGTELVYYAPDARVLLDESFLDTHCFRVVQGDPQAGVIGLSFEPMGRRRGIVDVSGTLWLSAETAELRWLDYLYANLELDVASPTAGGRVEFQRMEAGTWIIPEWWIEMPIIESRMTGNNLGSRPVLRGLRRSGGRVIAVHGGGGRVVTGRRQTGGVEGLVVDSVGAPLAGVRVGVMGGSQEAFTDAEGRFGLLGLSAGIYRVRFVEPRMARAGLAPPSVEREVIVGEISYLEFHMPTVSEWLREVCSAEPEQADVGVLVGRVVDQAGDPWPAATVRVTWSNLDFIASAGRVYLENEDGLEVSAGPDGSYSVCGVPTGVSLSVATVVGGTLEPGESVTIPRGGAGRIHEIGRLR
jgi:hypothetical protein